jgi:hypothetical protein
MRVAILGRRLEDARARVDAIGRRRGAAPALTAGVLDEKQHG